MINIINKIFIKEKKLNKSENIKFIKSAIIFSIFFGILFFNLNQVSAVRDCWVETNPLTCTENHYFILMNFSDITNAHASVSPSSGYNNVLCCNFNPGALQSSCASSDIIVKLSSDSNAHAERPTFNNYSKSVCYAKIKNIIFSNRNTQPGPREVLILKASSAGNAHLASPSDNLYQWKAIGTLDETTLCELTSAKWNPAGVVYNGTDVNMTVTGSSDCSMNGRINISFEVRRGTQRQYFTTGIWPLGSQDINVTWRNIQPPSDTNYSFTAWVTENPAERVTSPANLKIITSTGGGGVPSWCTERGINWCSNYANPVDCGRDPCRVAENTVENYYGLGSTFCDQAGRNCECYWANSRCDARWNNFGVNPQGMCQYNQNTQDDCSDGFLSFSWTATWIGSGPAPEYCQGGSQRTIACPAQIALPFFNIYNLIAVILIIALIYWIINSKGKKNKGHKLNKKK
ncbi:MAG: hypothetical protein QXX55_01935 [Candidatus Pacearchaeota archaeon]